MANLTSYLAQTNRLLQNPAPPTPLYATSDLTDWINIARGQVAGEAECIRIMGTLAVVLAQRAYNFTSIDVGQTTASVGLSGVINARQATYVVGSGNQWITPRPWEWFTVYSLNNPVPSSGAPESWAQFGQGVTGSLYFDPIPDTGYTVTLDTVCSPSNLTSDSSVEAIPYLWTDAVPYFAAYLALLSSQNGARQQDADRMFERYTAFTNRARSFATPSVLPGQYPQQPDPMAANRLGLAQGGR